MIYVNNSLLQPGALVKIRPGEDSLILWPSYRASLSTKESGRVTHNDVMIILKAKRSKQLKNVILMDEWQKGAYMVLSSTGTSGWIGEGWVTLIR